MITISRFSLIASALVVSTTAFAADLPAKKSAPPAPIAATAPMRMADWTGVYGGLTGGYGFGNFSDDGKTIFGSPTGGAIGVTGGYNYQMPNNWVLGAEADLSAANIKGSSTGSSELRYMNTVRARVGYAMGTSMPFVTAGYAGGTTHDDYSGSSADNYHNGYTVGAGVETVVTGPWTAKAEALYVHLNDQSIPSSGGNSGADLGLLRVGLNYRF